jgi:two-component system response regulator HydG
MSARMQAVLLRFAETGEIQQVGSERPLRRADVRLITATNRDLRAQITAGAFREDLYYRLNVIQIRVPPLRDRADDVMPLLRHFLQRASDAHHLPVPSLNADAAQLLVAYEWPGNVRELRNVAERLVLREQASDITPDDLPIDITGSRSVSAARAHQPEPEQPGSLVNAQADRLWDLMAAGESFWTVVYRAFKRHELTRSELAALIDRGLHETGGSYTALLKVFNLPATDYKRFHAFLYQQECNLPVASYRRRGPRRLRDAGGSERQVA